MKKISLHSDEKIASINSGVQFLNFFLKTHKLLTPANHNARIVHT